MIIPGDPWTTIPSSYHEDNDDDDEDEDVADSDEPSGKRKRERKRTFLLGKNISRVTAGGYAVPDWFITLRDYKRRE